MALAGANAVPPNGSTSAFTPDGAAARTPAPASPGRDRYVDAVKGPALPGRLTSLSAQPHLGAAVGLLRLRQAPVANLLDRALRTRVKQARRSRPTG